LYTDLHYNRGNLGKKNSKDNLIEVQPEIEENKSSSNEKGMEVLGTDITQKRKERSSSIDKEHAQNESFA
jgi:hypothetical protein